MQKVSVLSLTVQLRRNELGNRLSRSLGVTPDGSEELWRQPKRDRLIAGGGTARSRAWPPVTGQDLAPDTTPNLDRFIAVYDALGHRMPCPFSSIRPR